MMHQLRKRPAHRGGMIPAVALTAVDSGQYRELAIDAGFQIHLGKLVEVNRLAAAVAALLAQGVGRASRPGRRLSSAPTRLRRRVSSDGGPLRLRMGRPAEVSRDRMSLTATLHPQALPVISRFEGGRMSPRGETGGKLVPSLRMTEGLYRSVQQVEVCPLEL